MLGKLRAHRNKIIVSSFVLCFSAGFVMGVIVNKQKVEIKA